MTDEPRLREIQWQLRQVQMVNEVLLIVHSTIGGPIQGLPSLSERLKRMTSVLLEGMHSPSVHLFKIHNQYSNMQFIYYLLCMKAQTRTLLSLNL